MSVFGIVFGLVAAIVLVKVYRSRNWKNTETLASYAYETTLMDIANQMEITSKQKQKEIKNFRTQMDELRGGHDD